MKTLCCSDKCEKRFECAKADINNKGTHCVEDFYSFGTGTFTDNGCEIKHWCGEAGNWKMFEPILITDDIVNVVESVMKKCSGCIYENADGSTEDIYNCVCCNRMVSVAKSDNYRKI